MGADAHSTDGGNAVSQESGMSDKFLRLVVCFVWNRDLGVRSCPSFQLVSVVICAIDDIDPRKIPVSGA